MDIRKILVADHLDQSVLDNLRKKDVTVDVMVGLSEEQLVQVISNYDALIVRSGTTVTAAIIRAAKNVKVIGRAGVGVDNIDVQAATKAGIFVINSPGGNTIAATELTCSLILALSRNVSAACGALKGGVWDRKSFMGSEVYGKTLAVIGLGRIGREVAARMRSFGMKTIGYDPIVSPHEASQFGVEFFSLEQIWPQADFITLHVPLLEETKNLINQETLQKCKKGVRIVNVARGGIVDEKALLEAIESGTCAGAALDVFEEEPPKNSTLLQNPKVLCTPHLGASTREASVRVTQEVADQIIQLKSGHKTVHGLVNRQVLKA